jgi:hypothetical protein
MLWVKITNFVIHMYGQNISKIIKLGPGI